MFRCSLARECLTATRLIPFTVLSSARERNAVWLLEKARKANTKIFAGAVPDAFWNGPVDAGPSSGAAAAEAVHIAWDIAARVPRHSRSRGQRLNVSASARDGVPHQRSISSDDSTARGAAIDEKANHRTRDLGEGMERLRLCVSLLQKQVHVSARWCLTHVLTFILTIVSQMVQKVSVHRVRLPTVKFLLNSQG